MTIEQLTQLTLVQFLFLMIVATLCGAIGQALAGYSFVGYLIAAIVGFVGALIGVWLARYLHLPEVLPLRIGRETFPLWWAIVGSVLFASLVSLLSRRQRSHSHS